MIDFEVGKTYWAEDITGGEYTGIFDQLIALVDGKLEHLTDWHSELALNLVTEDGYEGEDAYDYALKDIEHEIWTAYENAKHVVMFKGVPPDSKMFDVFAKFECIYNESQA